MKQIKVHILLALLLCSLSNAQEDASSKCRHMLMLVVAKYAKLSQGLSATESKSFTMSMRSEPRKGKVQESKLEVMVSPGLFVAKNPDMLSISDTMYSFTMVKATKVLVRSKSQFAKLSDSTFVGVSQKMLDQISKFECAEIVYEGAFCQKIICTPNEDLAKEGNIERIEYLIDKAGTRIISSSIVYNTLSPIKSTVVKYTPIVQGTKPVEYGTSAQSYFFKDSKTLKDRFLGYKFFDNKK